MGDTTAAHEAPRLMLGDCLERMPEIESGSINLIACDPPYMNVKSHEAWDRQWKTTAAFLDWMGRLCAEWRRVLAPNGSLYVFASPRMAARVECKVGETFEVLNHIVWNKIHPYDAGDQRATAYRARDHESFRRFFDYSERIIFAEHFGADSIALGESGYGAKCDEAARDVFGVYITSVRKRNGLTMKALTAAAGAHGAVNHGGACSNWELGLNVPTRQYYDLLQAAFPGCFDRQYEDLRRQYEDLRRPFTVSAQVPYTDVWSFPTVPHRPGKHVCEKPLSIMSQIISASSRPGDVVLDTFMGSGVTGEAAITLGRRFIGIEQDPKWFDRAGQRISRARPGEPATVGDRPTARQAPVIHVPAAHDLPTVRPRRVADRHRDTPLFDLWSEHTA